MTIASSAVGPSVTTLDGVLVPNGSLIRVGTLLVDGDYTTFVEFGTTTVKSAGFGVNAKPSKVLGSVTNNLGEEDDSQFNDLPIYIWIYASFTESSSVPQGLFKSSFRFPVNDVAGVADSAGTSAVAYSEPVFLPFHFYQATYLPTASNLTGAATGGRWVLGGIPETSTGVSASLGLLGLFAKRRR